MGRPDQDQHQHQDQLDEDQIASMREAFALFDADGDGQISPTDLGTIMRSLGSNPTQAHLRHIIDRERLSAAFGFDRFLELMSRYMKPESFESELRDAFRVLDKDGSGFVDVSDLRHILTSIGERLEVDEFDEWIREVDVADDGRFKYDAFIAQMVAK